YRGGGHIAKQIGGSTFQSIADQRRKQSRSVRFYRYLVLAARSEDRYAFSQHRETVVDDRGGTEVSGVAAIEQNDDLLSPRFVRHLQHFAHGESIIVRPRILRDEIAVKVIDCAVAREVKQRNRR